MFQKALETTFHLKNLQIANATVEYQSELMELLKTCQAKQI